MKSVRVEFDEEAHKPLLGTIRLWIDGDEIKDGLMKGTMIKHYAMNLPWTINPLADMLEILFKPPLGDIVKRLEALNKGELLFEEWNR